MESIQNDDSNVNQVCCNYRIRRLTACRAIVSQPHAALLSRKAQFRNTYRAKHSHPRRMAVAAELLLGLPARCGKTTKRIL